MRHSECLLVLEVGEVKCAMCVSYRTQLNILLSMLGKHRENSNPRSHTNYRYLSDTEKNSCMKQLHQDNRKAQRKIKHLEEKVTKLIEVEGEQMDELTSYDMKEIMEENKDHIEAKYPKNSFMYLFWKQQEEARAVATGTVGLVFT